ncbi:hypothetical protein SDC9_31444 [bioreactor metagenome]|uniref:Uncharacterized protein n=1 Tax=bioreactor metagenome TaxID=1076179 RepID=A0A644V354_9ZZZZ
MPRCGYLEAATSKRTVLVSCRKIRDEYWRPGAEQSLCCGDEQRYPYGAKGEHNVPDHRDIALQAQIRHRGEFFDIMQRLAGR